MFLCIANNPLILSVTSNYNTHFLGLFVVSQFSLENLLLIATLHMGPSQEVENLEVTGTQELHMEQFSEAGRRTD